MQPHPISRREALQRAGTGLGTLGLIGVLGDAGLLGPGTEAATNPLAPKKPHFPAKAKRIIHIFLNGGPSHLDTFDPKPLLTKHHGKMLPMPNLRTERKTGGALASPFQFKKYECRPRPGNPLRSLRQQ